MPSARRISFRILVLVVAGLGALAVGAGLAAARPVAKPIGTGVVVIDTNLSYQNASAAGTGMVLTPSGRILTNNHVVRGATSIKVVLPGTGRSYTGDVIGYDVTDDVAVIQLQGATNLKTVSLSTLRLRVGQTVRALGNALGRGRLVSAAGHITGLGKTITASDGATSETLNGLIETNANLQPGDSGGPLLDARGRVVGMDTAGSTGNAFQAAAPSTDGYAIPIGNATAIASQIVAGTASANVHLGGTAFLGVQVSDAPGYGYGSATVPGALIVGVVPGGPAATAGLVPGDLITSVDGTTISSADSLTGIVLSLQPGGTATIDYTDDSGAAGTATVTLGSGPPQ